MSIISFVAFITVLCVIIRYDFVRVAVLFLFRIGVFISNDLFLVRYLLDVRRFLVVQRFFDLFFFLILIIIVVFVVSLLRAEGGISAVRFGIFRFSLVVVDFLTLNNDILFIVLFTTFIFVAFVFIIILIAIVGSCVITPLYAIVNVCIFVTAPEIVSVAFTVAISFRIYISVPVVLCIIVRNNFVAEIRCLFLITAAIATFIIVGTIVFFRFFAVT